VGYPLRILEEGSAIKVGSPRDFYDMPTERNFICGGVRDRIKA
jgi:hypothetical protein